MFLRIDVYQGGGGGSLATPNSSQTKAPDQTLYAYPAIASISSDIPEGSVDQSATSKPLLTVGRKDPADVLLQQDKSVSRMHCTVKLVPKKERGGNVALVAVLENSSKTGCYIVRPRKKTTDGESNVHDDSDATDVEDGGGGPAVSGSSSISQTQRNTDSQAAHQPTQQKLSLAAVQILQSRGHRADDYDLELVGANQTNELLELGENGGMVILQCGKLDSTLVLTRQDLLVHNKTKTKLDNTFLASIGACAVEERYGLFTHLITNSYSPTTSQLFAWCRQATFVTRDYFLALSRRTSAKDPMPNVKDYQPEGARIISEDGKEEESFWTLPPPSWNSWTYLTEKPRKSDEEEMIHLIRATGATVEIVTTDLRDFPIPRNSFALASKKLLTKTKLKQAGVLVCDKRELATKLTQQLYPDGNPAPTQLEQTATITAPAPVPPPVALTQPTLAREARTQNQHNHDSQPRRERTEQEELDREVSQPFERSNSQVGPTAEQDNCKSSKKESSSTSSSLCPPRVTKATQPLRDEDDAKDSDLGDHTQEGTNSRKRNHEGGNNVVDENDDTVDENRPSAELRSSKKAKPLENGWFVAVDAAEKDKMKQKRNHESRNPVSGDEDDHPTFEPAATDRVKGLLLDNPLGQRTGRNCTGSKVDFRGFRKNLVVGADNSHVVSIKLVSVPANESQSALHMEEQRLEFEERHRLAEELFRDPNEVAGGGRARSRR